MHADPHPDDLRLYQQAIIAKTFPAYTVESARHATVDTVRALQLLDIAAKIQSV